MTVKVNKYALAALFITAKYVVINGNKATVVTSHESLTIEQDFLFDDVAIKYVMTLYPETIVYTRTFLEDLILKKGKLLK